MNKEDRERICQVLGKKYSSGSNSSNSSYPFAGDFVIQVEGGAAVAVEEDNFHTGYVRSVVGD